LLEKKKKNIDFFAIDSQQIFLKLLRKKGICANPRAQYGYLRF